MNLIINYDCKWNVQPTYTISCILLCARLRDNRLTVNSNVLWIRTNQYSNIQ